MTYTVQQAFTFRGTAYTVGDSFTPGPRASLWVAARLRDGTLVERKPVVSAVAALLTRRAGR